MPFMILPVPIFEPEVVSEVKKVKVISVKFNLEDLAVCPVDYCENDGRCYIEENVQKCKCRSRFYGHRCQKLRTLENGNLGMPSDTAPP